ncbi:fimbrial protein [Atlantibacter sp.]|uniref:fimbrial protein n=1 Tax=Atlantibacter sp. TaxID=1903473 RepID=UPI0028A9CB25|nr:fimbrial protein [Atlantibacter sp.]
MYQFIRAFLFLFGFALPVSAADVTINIAGNIVNTPCTVAGGATTNVDLGRYEEVISQSDDYAYPVKYFTLDLINCPIAWDTVKLQLEGDWDAVNAVLKNSGTAQNVGIKISILNSDSAWISAGDCITNDNCLWPINKETGEVHIQFSAQPYNFDGGITAGSVSGQLAFTITYQ